MTLKVDIDSDTERTLQEEASRKGMDAEELAADLVCQGLTGNGGSCGDRESKLLTKINQGWSEDHWLRYRELLKLRDDRELSKDSHDELLLLTAELEGINARRIGYLAELAKIRGIKLPELMKELGINPRSP